MYSEIAQARPKPSYVDVPLPNSSMMMRESSVADLKSKNTKHDIHLLQKSTEGHKMHIENRAVKINTLILRFTFNSLTRYIFTIYTASFFFLLLSFG